MPKNKFELSLAGMKYIPAFLLLFWVSADTVAQSTNYIKGKVVNGESSSVIPNASVFITNTSRGTVSNAAGEFELTNVPVGTYDLIVSSIGYETQVYTYNASQLPLRIQIQMQPKAEELQTVVVEPFEKDGWETWGKFFTENFIGTSDNARSCTIKNYKALRFRHSKKKNLLTVVSDEPLIIENKALGYKINYQLEEFSYNFKENTLLYFGYTLFNELNRGGPKTWQLKNRERAYNGSIAHFMQSLYYDSLAERGFEVRRLVKTSNLEKERIKKMYRENHTNAINSKDSAAYYNKILRQPDMLEKYGPSLLTADSLVTIVDTASKRLGFTDFLYVTFKNEKEDAAYLKYAGESRPPFHQRSVVFLLDHAVFIDARGNYFMPQDLMSYGYWAWSEKIAALLPMDYK